MRKFLRTENGFILSYTDGMYVASLVCNGKRIYGLKIQTIIPYSDILPCAGTARFSPDMRSLFTATMANWQVEVVLLPLPFFLIVDVIKEHEALRYKEDILWCY